LIKYVQVLLYSTDLINLYNITGDQLGAYFGYSICVSDVDGDGGDDIIIGAPLYSEFSKNDGSYETGKVYVYLKKEVHDNNNAFIILTLINFMILHYFNIVISVVVLY
jgi:hypothetical protein